MKIGIPREVLAGELRVAAVPETVAGMRALGFNVVVEAGAGEGALIEDAAYNAAGAEVLQSARVLFSQSDILLKVNRLLPDDGTGRSEINDLRPGTIVIGVLEVRRFPESLHLLNEKKITAFSLDMLPRTARAQSMDVLSSMSNIAGYRSVLTAAVHLKKFFPMLTTAAGSVAPARVFVIGAGVAGLQAVATAKRLGALVAAFDPRPEVAEQVKSLGAGFVPMPPVPKGDDFLNAELALLAPYVKEADVVITTALIPGKAAPILLTEDMVKAMRPGSVIVDLAAEQGGNCEVSVLGRTVSRYGVIIAAETGMPATMAAEASRLYARNVAAFLQHVFPDGQHFTSDMKDDIVYSTLITHQGRTVHTALQTHSEHRERTA